MALPEEMLQEHWDHDEAAHRLERLAIEEPSIRDRMARLALRFISAKGLSVEFEKTLREIVEIEGKAEVSSGPEL